MEHLRYGSATSMKLGTDKFRCYCSDIHRMTGRPDFYSFTTGAHGWTVQQGQLCEPKTREFPIRNASEFLQRWLYFEVLREVFYKIPEFNIELFVVSTIRSNDTDRYLSTEPLERLLSSWRTSLSVLTRPWNYITRLQDVLNYARRITTTYCAVLESNKSDYSPAWKEVQEDAILSVMLLGEVLTEALRKIQKQIKFNTTGWNIMASPSCGWGYSSLVLQKLNENGWEPRAIDHLRVRLKGNTNALLYVLLFQRPIVTRNITGIYTPKHHCGQPDKCELVCLDRYDEVLEIIRNNETPLFRYDPQALVNPLTVETYSGRPTGYIVVSHVWADGYGNTSVNGLNRCVLQWFCTLFAENSTLGKQLDTNGNSSLARTRLFWIDTLGIPVDEAYKNDRVTAISRMHRIYRNADATFVLDNEIMSQTKDDKWVHAAMRISLGNWMRRLWTLQEAVLNRELFFVFQNGAVSIQNLETDNSFRYKDRQLHRCISEVAYQYSRCILRPEVNARQERRTSDFVGKVWQAAQWRTTTHRHHETLSLATLFELDTSSFASASNRKDQDNGGMERQFEDDLDQRMKRFLELLTEKDACIPAGFLFLPPPHLPYEGLRWAPRSWLSESPVENPEIYPMQGPGCNTYGTSGLCAELPGFILHELQHNLSQLIGSEGFFFTTHQDLHDWYYVERLNLNENDPDHYLNSWVNVGGSEPTRIAIIHLSYRVSEQPQVALLVSITKQDQRRTFGIILCRVKISRVIDSESLTKQQAIFRDITNDPLCYGMVLDATEWVIDGPEPPKDPLAPMDDDLDDQDPGRFLQISAQIVSKARNRLTKLTRRLTSHGQTNTGKG